MLTVTSDGIGSVHRVVALGSQKVGLRRFRPMRKMPGFTMVHFANFLQTQHIGLHAGHRMAEVVNLQTAHRAKTLHTLVDVVGHNAQICHASLLPNGSRSRCISIKMASALEGEKQRSAASAIGSQQLSVCSVGLN